MFHSKNWDEYRDRLDGRDVVLVGMGPSGIDLAGFLVKIQLGRCIGVIPAFMTYQRMLEMQE